MTLIAVTFNCSDDWNCHLKLFEYGYENYKMTKVLKEGIIEVEDKFYEATPFIPESLIYPMKDDENYKVIIYLEKDPKNKIIGKAYLILNNKKVSFVDVYRYY